MDLSIDNILMALGLTLVAGMSTGVGALLAFFTKHTNQRFLAGALGLSAGVMLYVSFMDLIPVALNDIVSDVADPRMGKLWVILAFFVGIALIALIDWLIPEDENPHEVHTMDELTDGTAVKTNHHHLKRTGMMLALAIGIHNFPEGVATFVSSLNGLDVALPIVVAIAIHNIPEGIAVSVPIYHATGDRRRALMMSVMSGLAEPLGALVGLFLLIPVWTPTVSALLLSGVAGIMVYISLDELLPNAEQYGYHHVTIGGVIAGMAFMAFSLMLF